MAMDISDTGRKENSRYAIPHIKISAVGSYCGLHAIKCKSDILYNFLKLVGNIFTQDNYKNKTNAMLANETLKTFVPTVKPQEAKAFYQDVLELTLVSEDSYGMNFDSGGSLLRIATVPELKPHPFTTLGWDVKDIEAVIHSLTSKGVVFEKYGFFPQDDLGIWTAPDNTKVAWFKDPDGNTLGIAQMP